MALRCLRRAMPLRCLLDVLDGEKKRRSRTKNHPFRQLDILIEPSKTSKGHLRKDAWKKYSYV